MPKAAIALGSNLGNREHNLRTALAQLATLGTVTATSTFHDTTPAGLVDQPRFLNAAALLETEIAPEALMPALLAIEQTMGRDRSTAIPPKGPRLIDLDLLLYDNAALKTEALTLPHPELHNRVFVLSPLAEIAPDWPHPTLHRTIAELHAAVR